MKDLIDIPAREIPLFPSKPLKKQVEEFVPKEIPEYGELAKIKISIYEILGYYAKEVYIYSKFGLSLILLAIKVAALFTKQKEQEMDSKNWWKSKAIWSGIVGVIILVIGFFGVTIDEQSKAVIIDNTFAIIEAVTLLIALIGGIFGRKSATTTIK